MVALLLPSLRSALVHWSQKRYGVATTNNFTRVVLHCTTLIISFRCTKTPQVYCKLGFKLASRGKSTSVHVGLQSSTLQRQEANVAHSLQGAKVLLLGDSRAFFTMYKAIVDVGLKPFQLDRDEALLKAGLPAEELKRAAGEAAAAADCLLVTHQQLASPGFPFDRCKGCAVVHIQCLMH